MAQITINEISQNYTYNIGTNSFATVAMPITAMWGPAYTGIESEPEPDVDSGESKYDLALEKTSWKHFSATQEGLESFVATYRGPASNYKLAKDYSYQMAMTLLTAGYDVLTCRVCPGNKASASQTVTHSESDTKTTGVITITAKYPGTFGNNLKVKVSTVDHRKSKYFNAITYVVDSSGIETAVENLIFVFDRENSTDSIPHIDEVESDFIVIKPSDNITDDFSISFVAELTGGTDLLVDKDLSDAWAQAKEYATIRYTSEYDTDSDVRIGVGYESSKYLDTFDDTDTDKLTKIFANTQMNKEWIYNAAFVVYNLLQDKLNYNPQRIISSGWDDQDICSLTNNSDAVKLTEISPLHYMIMETAYYSRCATGMIDIPKSEKRSCVYNETSGKDGYAQMLARIGDTLETTSSDVNKLLYTTHSALFAPWGSYKYVGTGKQYAASPSFLALMIQRAQILNQSLQYEWALPTNRKHDLSIGKMDYEVPKKLLDKWQKLEGVGVNVITTIPDLGLNLWGNSTLYEVPAATYQALANLSTRYLVNAVEDVAYRCGLAITFQYNNEQAYNTFYAGVTPTLDTMKNVGAIEDYYVKMAADVNGLDQVNANSVVGKIYLVINGVINDITIDLIALPPGTDLNQYRT